MNMELKEKLKEIAKRDDQKAVISELETMISEVEDKGLVLQYIAFAYLKLENFESAEEYLIKALDQNELLPLSHGNLGYLSELKSEFNDAVDSYTRALEIDSSIYEIWYNLFMLQYHNLNNKVEAMEVVGKALEANPSDEKIFELAFSGYRIARDFEKAADLLLTRNPNISKGILVFITKVLTDVELGIFKIQSKGRLISFIFYIILLGLPLLPSYISVPIGLFVLVFSMIYFYSHHQMGKIIKVKYKKLGSRDIKATSFFGFYLVYYWFFMCGNLLPKAY
jgi:tetratricopeptide (TPR) repeat protein